MATLVRWEPFRELAQLQGEMGRLVNGLLEGQGRGAQQWVPSLDVWETDAELVYAFDLPGVPEEQIQIEVQDDTLTISGERARETTEQDDRFYRFERRYGSFGRAVGLPAGIDDSKIEASYVDGVLEVRVPKPEEAKPRRIQLGSAHADVDATPSNN
ncbi:MAG TPA: Hsp20/alpha crystallin family protein [Gaiella sp.]|nr:Hsp20/alpha crystallin family protein [Gaiella sp.]